MLSTRLNNRAAIVSKEYRRYNFFGSHVRRPKASRSNWLQHLNPGATECSIQSLFSDQWMIQLRHCLVESKLSEVPFTHKCPFYFPYISIL